MTPRQIASALLAELIILEKQKYRLITALSKMRHRAAHAEQVYQEMLIEGSQPRDERMDTYAEYEKERR